MRLTPCKAYALCRPADRAKRLRTPKPWCVNGLTYNRLWWGPGAGVLGGLARLVQVWGVGVVVAPRRTAAVTRKEKRQAAALAAGQKAAAEGAAERQSEGDAKVKKQALSGLPPLPKLPKVRKEKPLVACECGCDGLTRARFVSGHDGRLHGWVLRVERGVVKAEDVPAPHTEAVARVLAAKQAAA